MRRFGILALGIVFAGACGGDGDGPTDPDGTLSVTLTAPADQAVVSGVVSLQATATDADRVVFFVDQTELGADATAPYSLNWDSSSVGDGAHTLRAVAERGDDRAEDTAPVVVDNVASGITVTVQPTTAQVALGATRQFNATVVGSGNASVTWTVVGGATFGAINATGLYTAPATLPTPAAASVRATSVADPAQFAIAAVTLVDNGGGGFPADQTTAVQAAFSLGTTATETAQSLIEDDGGVVGIVFLASSLNGNALTTSGTLTQSQPNSGTFTYAAQPTDKLVVQLAPGPRIEIVITSFEGDLSGDVLDFARFHSDLGFRITVPQTFDVTIQSRSGSPGAVRPAASPRFEGGAAWSTAEEWASAGRSDSRSRYRRDALHRPTDPQTNIAYERTVVGSVLLNGLSHQVDLALQGTLFFEVDSGFAQYERSDAVSGTITGPASTETLNEGSSSIIIVSDRVVENYTRLLDNSAVVGGVALRLQARVKRAFVEGRVADTDFWEAIGTLSRDGGQIGAVRFSIPPQEGSPAGNQPRVVVDLGGGSVIEL